MGCSTNTVGDFGCFQGFPETLPLEELAIGIGEPCWSMLELVCGVRCRARCERSRRKRLEHDARLWSGWGWYLIGYRVRNDI